MEIEPIIQPELPVKKTKNTINSSDLRINKNGIFVKGEMSKNPARIYEAMCAKIARTEHPGRFIISPRIVDSMSEQKESILSGIRPDILILEEISDANNELNGFTVLTGMQECKSDLRKNEGYGLSQKAGGFYEVISKLDYDPSAIGRDLQNALPDAFFKIPVDLSMVVVARVVDVTFITNGKAEEVSFTGSRMRFHYDVIKSPFKPIIPESVFTQVKQSIVLFNANAQ